MFCIIIAIYLARCLPLLFTVSDNTYLALAHLSAMINDLAGVVFLSVPPMLSSIWFPTSERTVATAIGLLSNWLGIAGSFAIGQERDSPIVKHYSELGFLTRFLTE
jgi:hypothetical protein